MYKRTYDREGGTLYDGVHIFVLVVAVVFIVFSALWDQIAHPHGVARPACEMRGGTWTKIGERNDRSHSAIHACRYRVTGQIREMP